MAVVTINDKEYEEDQLTDEQKYLVSQVRNIDIQLRNLQFQADQLNAARSVFMQNVVSSLASEPKVDEG